MTATDYLEQKILEAIFARQTLGYPFVYAGLFTAAPTDVGGGTEVTAASYSRVLVQPMSPSGGSVTNALGITFPPAGEAWGSIVSIGIFDDVTIGNLLLFDSFGAQPVVGGDTVHFAPGDFAVTVD